MDRPLWQPSADRIERANLTAFARRVAAAHGEALLDYPRLRAWSAEHGEAFWPALWRFAEVRASRTWDRVLSDGDRMPGARWFAGAELNFAENLLRHDDQRPAIVAWSEDGRRRELSAMPSCNAAVARARRGARGATAIGRRRSRGRGHAEHPRDHHRDAGDHRARRDLVVLLARLRRPGRARPLRPDRAQGADHGRRLPLHRQAASTCGRSSPRSWPQLPSLERGDHGALPRPRRRAGAARGAAVYDDYVGGQERRARVRAAAVRPPDLHPLLLRHDRRAQGDRARRRRHAAAAPQGAGAAHRPQAATTGSSTSPPAAG